jgi:thymidylate kinase
MEVQDEGLDAPIQCVAVAAELESRGFEVTIPTSDPQRPVRRTYKDLISREDSFPNARTSALLSLADYSYAAQTGKPSGESIELFDRYHFSACADAIALGLPREHVQNLLSMFENPDLAIYIDIDPELALVRKGDCTLAEAGGPDFAGQFPDLGSSFVAYQNALRDAYRSILESCLSESSVCVVDGSTSRDQLSHVIVEKILSHMPRHLADVQ